MRIVRIRTHAFFVIAAMSLLAVPSACAAYVININQVGADVVATGSGSLDVTDLTRTLHGGSAATFISPVSANIAVGTFGGSVDNYSDVPGFPAFGTGNTTVASIGSGAITGYAGPDVNGQFDILVPFNYVSGSALTPSTDTFSSKTLSSLGLTPGTYTVNWGTAPDADSFTVVVAPEPASLSLLALAGLALGRRRRS